MRLCDELGEPFHDGIIHADHRARYVGESHAYAEKLARDVFLVLDERWDVEGLRRVAESEDTHTEAIKALIDRYRLWDPSSVTWDVYYNNE